MTTEETPSVEESPAAKPIRKNISEPQSASVSKKPVQSAPKNLAAKENLQPVPSTAAALKPLERLLTTIVTIFWFAQLVTSLVGPSILFCYCALFMPFTRLFLLMYVGWLVYDQRSAHTGWKPNRWREFIRYHPVWDYFRSYFPGQLIKTHDLDPSRKYIIGYHPHGVYAISLFANVVFNRNWLTLFPGIETITCTLPANFWFPGWRDYALLLGSGTCTSGSIKYRLTHSDPGTSMIIALGGAEEFRYMDFGKPHHVLTSPGTIDLVIKKRKGFVKLALATGTSLVPILGFGENELFSRITSPALQPLHKLFQLLLKSSAPLFVGKYGTLMPKRHPLVTIVGKPIYVDRKIDNPTQEQIDELHQLYLQGLQDIYDQYKDVYHVSRSHEMRFVK
ncbi:2-acylglycerol O-acyltransferase 1 [Kappamyces sp. JEL0829]|nr:2-acylglycerol O-acyltransferase 1 [Kappamyces sp. JEL0829]